MHPKTLFTTLFIAGLVTASAAHAACEGSNGRGWLSGEGKGKFEMSASDGSCVMRYPGFINDTTNTSIPATQVTLTRAPKSGKITLSAGGLVYTPTAGFKGTDRFCTKNTSPEVKGTLSGCVTVTVR